MKTTIHRIVPPSELRSRFMAWKRARQFSAVAIASLATLKAVQRDGDRDQERRVRELQARHSDSTSGDGQTDLIAAIAQIPVYPTRGEIGMGTYLLTPSQRAELQAARPGSRSLVLFPASRNGTAAEASESEVLPDGYTPAPVAPYEPLISRDPEIEEQARREADEEIAELERCTIAVSFDSEPHKGIPIDYAPLALPVIRKTPAPAHATNHDNAPTIGAPSSFEALRAAVLRLRARKA